MKFLVFFLVIVAVAGYFFWDDLFGTGDGGSKAIVVDESIEGAGKAADEGIGKGGNPMKPSVGPGTAREGDPLLLLKEGRTADALALLERRKADGPLSDADLAAYCRALAAAGRSLEAGAALDSLLARRPFPREAVDAVLERLEVMEESAEKRRLLSRIAEGFGGLSAGQAEGIAAATAALNRDLPGSLEGLYRFEDYRVRPNDSLWTICREFNKKKGLDVEVGLLRWVNGIRGDNIHPGQSIRFPTDAVFVRVWKKSWILGVFLGDTLLAAYRVGLGKNGKTPEGTFEIATKLKDPPWNSRKLGRIVPPGDPENILGTRWLGFKSTPRFEGYGIHGTEDPSSIGKNMSDGCIRLLNRDVEELFEILARGTKVEIL